MSNTLKDPKWANATVLSGDIVLNLVKSHTFPKGITLQVYQPAGRPEYAA